jgi:hypothetical protein
MWTDAIGSTGFRSVLDVPAQARRTHGSFCRKEDIPLPICVKELKAVKFSQMEHVDVLQGRTVRLFQDNQAVVGAMRAFSSSSPAMMVELSEIWALLDLHQICFTIKYICSELNQRMRPAGSALPTCGDFVLVCNASFCTRSGTRSGAARDHELGFVVDSGFVTPVY